MTYSGWVKGETEGRPVQQPQYVPPSPVASTGEAGDLIGNFAVSNFNDGTDADATTYWRGDGTWAPPPGIAGSRTISTTAPLTGGGDLSADRTLAISAATTGAAGSMSSVDKTKLDAISGTNTGDQIITLTGDVTGSGAGSFATAIGAGKVTLAMQANMATASVVYRKTGGAGAPEVQTLTTLKTDLALTKADVGLSSADNTADSTKNVLSATKLTTARNINGILFDGSGDITINAVDSTARAAQSLTISTTAPLTGGGDLSAGRTLAISAATTAAAGSMSAEDKTRLNAYAPFYRTLLDASGSHIAAKAAGTYAFGQGDPLAVTGTGTLYPLNILYIDPADYPAIGTLAAKLRLRCALMINDTAPTGNFTIGLHPVTRPGTSGGAGLNIYTIGAALAGSTIAINTPAADSSTNGVGSDFSLPAAGFYCIGVVTTATVATNSHLHLSAALQMRYA